MMVKLVLSLGLVWMSTAALSAEFSVDVLMRNMAQHPGGAARFTETRFLAVLDKPLVSSGEMRYSPPDRLEKRTLLPRPEFLLLEKDTLTLERDRRRMSVRLSNRPEAQAFVDSIRSMLAGNQVSLEQNYRLQLEGDASRWNLTLYPKGAEIAAMIKRISVTGAEQQIRVIEYHQTDGDRAVLAIDPILP
jgi:hypothetical protein